VSAQLRLRLALAKSAGPRIVVSREDLEALIQAPPTPPRPEIASAVPAQRSGPPARPRRGGPVVALSATAEDAKRLARAAWDSDPNRVAEHGRWEDADPALTWHTVQAAERAIRALLGEAP
jgi:hypothetical protein